jgi:hypothetical protein
MGTLLVFGGGLVLWFLSASLVSIAFSLTIGAAYSLGKFAGNWLAFILASVVAVALGLTWSAILFLLADRIVEADYAVAWVTWAMAIVAAALPIGKAVESVQRHSRREALTADQDRLWSAMGTASWLQAIGMVTMLFWSAALDWWRWLPI